MMINQAALAGTLVGFKTIFNDAFAAAVPRWNKWATQVPSSTRSEEYKWLGAIPKMREWIGERVIQNLGAHEYTIKNKDWELTIGVDRNDFDDDTLGVYAPLFRAMGDSAATHPDEIVFELLHGGFVNLCYDGQPFFSTDHPVGAGTQSNKGTAALDALSYAGARAAMMSQLNEHGKPLGIVPDLLTVPPQLESVARQLLTAELIGGETNIYRGSAELLVLPELAAYPTEWFLSCTKRPVQPLIFQERKKPVFVAMDAPTDENVFNKKEFLYGVDGRDNAGYALWQLAYGSDGSQ